jgi:hypothetical protein
MGYQKADGKPARQDINLNDWFGVLILDFTDFTVWSPKRGGSSKQSTIFSRL